MKCFFVKHCRKFVVFYTVLTLIKLFTANIYLVREEDPTIYFKFCPTLYNTFYYGGDDSGFQQVYSEMYKWYANRQYWEIFHSPGGMQEIVEILYHLVIGLWWCISIFLIIHSLCKFWRRER